jgi:hypothetical protein
MMAAHESTQSTKDHFVDLAREKEDEEEENRVLIYPKAYVTITLDIPRAKSVYIIVKVKT